ncbi:tetratricopeptide repeat protein [Streptomyces sp. NPDC056909]|uniref:tetratricopeptide repeat protein n=1 Tax=Streptomyces sp. NPDC056909 TaxID=3345963 RepID=UPI00367F82BF
MRWFGRRRERDGKGTGGTERSGAPEPRAPEPGAPEPGAPEPGARESGRTGGEETPPLPGEYADDTDGPASMTPLQIAACALRAFVQGDEERAVSLCETAVLVGAGTELFAMAEYRLGIGVADHQAVRHLLDAAGVGGMAPAHPFPRAEALNNLRARDAQWTELCRRARSGDGPSCSDLGVLLRGWGDETGAEHWYRKAIDAGDPTASGANNLGNLLRDQGRPDDAVPWWTRAAEQGAVASMVSLGALAYERGDTALAERWFRAAITAGDPDGVAATNMGGIAHDQGRTGKAAQWWTQAVDKGHAPALTQLAGLAMERGDLESAERLLRQALEQGDPHALNALAILLERIGRTEDGGPTTGPPAPTTD